MAIQLNAIPTLQQSQMPIGQIVKVGNIDIWYETFGNNKNPPLLLIMGSGAQGVLWPTEFCEKLATEGFYVIRYDQRDTGFTTCFNFETNPYDLSDMAKDAIGLLDFLKIPKAHLLGFSMGGPVAEYMAVHFQDKVDTISLMATSPDFFPAEGSLSKSTEEYNTLRSKSLQIPIENETLRLNQRVAMWNLQNGSKTPLDENWVRSINQVFFSRMRNTKCLGNHGQAMKRSESLIRTVPSQVQVPTLIFHGSEDPVFPPDHGDALAKAIPRSRYIPVNGMGHLLNPHFYPIVIEEIKKHAKCQ